MKRKIISVLLCVFLLLPFLPASVFAETSITKIEVFNVPMPVVGAPTEFDASALSVVTTPPGGCTITRVRWVNATDTSSDDTVFEAGCTYYLTVRLTPVNEYAFKWSSTGLSFGGSAYIDDVKVSRTLRLTTQSKELILYSVNYTPATPIQSVDITGVPMIVPGASTEIDPSDITVTPYPADSCGISNILWYNATEQSYNDPTFKSGCKYRLDVILTTKTGYSFSEASAPDLLIGNQEPSQVWFFPDGAMEMMSADVTPPVPISAVHVSDAPEPLPGASAEIRPSDVTVTTVPADACTVTSALWYNVTEQSYNDQTIKAGCKYRLDVILTPKEGYGFTETATATRTVLGDAPSRVWFFGDLAMEMQSADVTPALTISSVEITHVPTPRTAASTEIRPSDVTVTTVPADAATVTTVMWYNATERSYNDSTFKPGCSYRLDVILTPKEGYKFTENGTVTRTVSGAAPSQEWFFPDGAMEMQSADVALALPLSKIEITGVPLPVVGASTSISASALSAVTQEENAAVITEAAWMNISDQEEDTTFQAGKQYVLSLVVSAQNGYFFVGAENEALPGTTASIEGLETEFVFVMPGELTMRVNSAPVSPGKPAVPYGDATGDDKVDSKDLSLLRKYMAAYDYTSGTSTVGVEAGADANGDGKIDSKDLSLLRKYMAAYDYTTGTSTVVLGPTK